MEKHIRRGREFWARLVEEFEAAGGLERHKAFAVRHGVRCYSFQRWLYRLRHEGLSVGHNAGGVEKRARTARALPWPLVEVQSGRVTDSRFELESPSGWRVRVPPSFEAEGLRRLLAIFDEERTH